MSLPARLFGPDGEEIVDLDSWLMHAPPEKGLAQLRPQHGLSNAVRAERLLANAVLLTHEGYRHLSFPNPSTCVDTAMVDLPDRADHPAEGHGLPVRSAALRCGYPLNAPARCRDGAEVALWRRARSPMGV